MADLDKEALEKRLEQILRLRLDWPEGQDPDQAVADVLREITTDIRTYLEHAPTTIGSRGRTAEGVETVVVEIDRSVIHHKRGSSYDVLGDGEVQISNPPAFFQDGTHGRCLREGDKLTIYRAKDGRLFLRDPDEFNDGRFGAMTSPEAMEG